MTTAPALSANPQADLDAHTRQIIQWHFSPDTGCPFWLEHAAKHKLDPIRDVQKFDDITKVFDHFHDDVLRFEQPERWIPRKYLGRPFSIFETGGTTGMPKQRIGWDDYKIDYEQFSASLEESQFPHGSYWLMIGPTGPRRLRLAIEHLANFRGSSAFFVDLDPRWVKRVISQKHFDQAKAYMEHVIDQAVTIMNHRKITCLFTTPKLLEALGEKINVAEYGIKGVFVGGTTIAPQYARFLCEEVLESRVGFVPTYGNTLMGLAAHKPGYEKENYSISYYAPQPRAVLRVVDPKKTDTLVNYDQWGRVELTTLTQEFFLPRFLERDEALRKAPCKQYPWDGVAEVRPFGASEKPIVEGVY
jgi:phenylacetate-coenzyme A ligase PaaK-like adenylate-forming protein